MRSQTASSDRVDLTCVDVQSSSSRCWAEGGTRRRHVAGRCANIFMRWAGSPHGHCQRPHVLPVSSSLWPHQPAPGATMSERNVRSRVAPRHCVAYRPQRGGESCGWKRAPAAALWRPRAYFHAAVQDLEPHVCPVRPRGAANSPCTAGRSPRRRRRLSSPRGGQAQGMCAPIYRLRLVRFTYLPSSCKQGAQGSGARAAEARPRRPTPTASSRTGSHVWTVMDELREARSERDALREEASVLRDSNKQLAAKLSGTSMLLENLKVCAASTAPTLPTPSYATALTPRPRRAVPWSLFPRPTSNRQRRHETTQTRARELEDEVEASHEDARRQEAAHEAAVAELDARLADTRREVEEARQALAAEQQARAQDQQAAAAQADELRRALEQEAAVGREEYSLLEKAAQSGDAKDARIAELKEEVAAMRSSLMQARANALHRTLSQVRAASQQAQEKMQRRLAKAQAELAARDASLKEAQSERDAALRQVRDLGQAQLPEGDLLEQVQRMQRAVEADCHCTPTRGGHHRANVRAAQRPPVGAPSLPCTVHRRAYSPLWRRRLRPRGTRTPRLSSPARCSARRLVAPAPNAPASLFTYTLVRFAGGPRHRRATAVVVAPRAPAPLHGGAPRRPRAGHAGDAARLLGAGPRRGWGRAQRAAGRHAECAKPRCAVLDPPRSHRPRLRGFVAAEAARRARAGHAGAQRPVGVRAALGAGARGRAEQARGSSQRRGRGQRPTERADSSRAGLQRRFLRIRHRAPPTPRPRALLARYSAPTTQEGCRHLTPDRNCHTVTQ